MFTSVQQAIATPHNKIRTFVTFTVLISQFVISSIGIVQNDFGQDPFTAGCHLTRHQIVWFTAAIDRAGIRMARAGIDIAVIVTAGTVVGETPQEQGGGPIGTVLLRQLRFECQQVGVQSLDLRIETFPCLTRHGHFFFGRLPARLLQTTNFVVRGNVRAGGAGAGIFLGLVG